MIKIKTKLIIYLANNCSKFQKSYLNLKSIRKYNSKEISIIYSKIITFIIIKIIMIVTNRLIINCMIKTPKENFKM
jgi:hypothetical protein